jgi:hypothetical protein
VGFDDFPVPRCLVRLEAKSYHASVFEKNDQSRHANFAITSLLSLTF